MRALGFTALLFSLVGCHTAKLCVTPISTRVSDVRIGLQAGGRCDQLAQISTLSFRQDDAELWYASTARVAPLSEVRYGVVPPDFATGMDAPPLVVGQQLRVDVRGPGVEGFAVFELTP